MFTCHNATAGDITLPHRTIEDVAVSSNEFGATLRSWRDRLSPEEFGLPTAPRRRARGLRREELANLAGVSPDYLIQLEQGRASAPSPQVLSALARALRLTEAEWAHLFRLADQLVPDEKCIRDTLPHSVRRLVEQLSASPAAVYDVRWNPIAWNVMWAAAMGDPLERPERERNMAWRHFTGLPTRVARTLAEQREYEETIVADLRSSYGRYPGDQGLEQLIADLREASSRFRSLWEMRRVGVYEQERKVIDHPELGLLHVDSDILTTHRNDVRIVVYTAGLGSPSAKALKELNATCADREPLMDPRTDRSTHDAWPVHTAPARTIPPGPLDTPHSRRRAHRQPGPMDGCTNGRPRSPQPWPIRWPWSSAVPSP
jgi:transcriptional regulator with XRE-family HTH domain